MLKTQESVLRHQFAKLESDEAIVAFAEENRVILEDDAVADLAEKAAEAYDRLEAKKASELSVQTKAQDKIVEVKSEAEANRERRHKIAGIFEAKGFDEAAVAIEQELDGADAKTLNEVVKTLDRAIPEAGLYGWAKHWAYQHRNSAKNALDQMGQATTIKLFVWLSTLVNRALRAIEGAKNARTDSFKAGMVRQAEERLTEAKSIRFQGWALAALERLIDESFDGKSNVVAEAFLRDSTLAPNPSDERKATLLINTLIERVERALATVHVGPMRSGKTERDHASRSEDRRVKRAAADAEYRNSMKGHNPSADKHGKKKSK